VTTSRFIRALGVADLPPGGGTPVEIEGRLLAIFNVDGQFHAIDNECPHRGASLADGALSGPVLTCPLHRWQFDLRDGKNPLTPDLGVRLYAVEVRDGAVWIDVAAHSDAR
jgi:nitrite reductase/ring-hydroxylating ferredoxin subunit